MGEMSLIYLFRQDKVCMLIKIKGYFALIHIILLKTDYVGYKSFLSFLSQFITAPPSLISSKHLNLFHGPDTVLRIRAREIQDRASDKLSSNPVISSI